MPKKKSDSYTDSSFQGQNAADSAVQMPSGSGRGGVFSVLLDSARAPNGDIRTDFKTALYVCAASKHFSFEEMMANGKLPVLSFMLASVGYKGNTSGLTIQNYLDTLQELVHEGALTYIGHGAGFVATDFSREGSGQVVCRLDEEAGNGMTKLFVTEAENTYPLFSKFVVVPGDEVKVVINTFLNIAYVTEITKMRAMIVGTVSAKKQIFFRERGFLSYDVRMTRDGVEAKQGDMIVAEIVARKSPNILIARCREVVQERGTLNSFIVDAVLTNDLPNVWPDEVRHSVKSVAQKVTAAERRGRVDLRELPLVTIDSESARDFDDAVYCEVVDDKFHLYVAIADVSYYVRPGSALDAEAHNRTTSVYFPFYVIPMLPEELSNGICSLNPHEDRLCMVCDMMITRKGKIESYKFYPAVMNSHARLTYTEVHNMIVEGKAIMEEHQECIPWIKDLYALYKVLSKASDARGVFEIERAEMDFLFDQNMNITGMAPEVRNEAHKLIEECMIVANVCAATFVKENKYQTLYRVHEGPSEVKLEKLRGILARYGLELRGADKPTPHDYKQLLKQMNKVTPALVPVIHLQILRSLSKACYQPDNVGHYGLALENYAHFTSPIRRYPDLQLHRVIKYILEKQEKRSWGKIGSQVYTHEALEQLGQKCSSGELRADNAEFDVENSLKCEYVKNFAGKVVDGTVSTICSIGVFVTLNDFFIDGMLSAQYVISYDQKRNTVVLPGNQVLGLGSQIKVRIDRVDSMNRRIELLPVDNMRKSDRNYDLGENMEQIRSRTVTDIKPDNSSKEEFFERIADISGGIKPQDQDIVVREHVNYSLDQLIDQPEHIPAAPKTTKARAAKTRTAKDAEAKAAPAAESLAALSAPVAPAAKETGGKIPAPAKAPARSTRRKQIEPVELVAQMESEEPVLDSSVLPEVAAAESAARSAAESMTAVDNANQKALIEDEETARLEALSSAIAAAAAARARIPVRAQKDEAGAVKEQNQDNAPAAPVEKKAKKATTARKAKAKSNTDDTDPLLIDTASRIDADLPVKQKSKTRSAKADKAEAAAVASADSAADAAAVKAATAAPSARAASSKRSNARARQDELKLSAEASGETRTEADALETMVENTKAVKTIAVAKPAARKTKKADGTVILGSGATATAAAEGAAAAAAEVAAAVEPAADKPTRRRSKKAEAAPEVAPEVAPAEVKETAPKKTRAASKKTAEAKVETEDTAVLSAETKTRRTVKAKAKADESVPDETASAEAKAPAAGKKKVTRKSAAEAVSTEEAAPVKAAEEQQVKKTASKAPARKSDAETAKAVAEKSAPVKTRAKKSVKSEAVAAAPADAEVPVETGANKAVKAVKKTKSEAEASVVKETRAVKAKEPKAEVTAKESKTKEARARKPKAAEAKEPKAEAKVKEVKPARKAKAKKEQE